MNFLISLFIFFFCISVYGDTFKPDSECFQQEKSKGFCTNCECAKSLFDYENEAIKRKEEIEKGVSEILMNASRLLSKELAMIDFDFSSTGSSLISKDNTEGSRLIKSSCSIDTITERLPKSCRGIKKQGEVRKRIQKYFKLENEQELVLHISDMFNSYAKELNFKDVNSCLSNGDITRIMSLSDEDDSLYEDIATSMKEFKSIKFQQVFNDYKIKYSTKNPLEIFSLIADGDDEIADQISDFVDYIEAKPTLKNIFRSHESLKNFQTATNFNNSSSNEGLIIKKALSKNKVKEDIRKNIALKCNNYFQSISNFLCGGPNTSLVSNKDFQKNQLDFDPEATRESSSAKLNGLIKEGNNNLGLAFSCLTKECKTNNVSLTTNALICEVDETGYDPDEMINMLLHNSNNNITLEKNDFNQAYVGRSDNTDLLRKGFCPTMLCKNSVAMSKNSKIKCSPRSRALNMKETVKALNCNVSRSMNSSFPICEKVKLLDSITKYYDQISKANNSKSSLQEERLGSNTALKYESSFFKNFEGKKGKMLRELRRKSKSLETVVILPTSQNSQLAKKQARAQVFQVTANQGTKSNYKKPAIEKMEYVKRGKEGRIFKGSAARDRFVGNHNKNIIGQNPNEDSQFDSLPRGSKEGNKELKTREQRKFAGNPPFNPTPTQKYSDIENEMRREFDKRKKEFAASGDSSSVKKVEAEISETKDAIEDMKKELAAASEENTRLKYENTIDQLNKQKSELEELKRKKIANSNSSGEQASEAISRVSASSGEVARSLARVSGNESINEESIRSSSPAAVFVNKVRKNVGSQDLGIAQSRATSRGQVSVTKSLEGIEKLTSKDMIGLNVDTKKGEEFRLILKEGKKVSGSGIEIPASIYSIDFEFENGKYIAIIPESIPDNVFNKLRKSEFYRLKVKSFRYRKKLARVQKLNEVIEKSRVKKI